MGLISFSGLASGIDSKALIEATTAAARKQRVEPNETKVSELEETNSTLDELKTKLSTLQTALKEFATLSGGGVVKQGQSSDETKVSATATNAASNGTYGVTVTQLARNHTYTFRSNSGTYSSATQAIAPALSTSGTAAERVTVTVGSPTALETVTIDLTSATTLSGFVSSFNSQATTAQASVVNVGTDASPDYRIMLNSFNTGVTEGQLTVTIGANITGAGVGQGDAFNNNSENTAANSTFTVAGVGTISRESNTIADVIPGVTFNLRALGTASVSITDDAAATLGKVQEFVDAYNEAVNFIKENNQITREEDGQNVTNIFSPLSKTRVDDNALLSLRSAISSTRYSPGDGTLNSIKIFADLGITTQRDGTIKLDEDDFTTALTTEPESVNEILTTFADTTSVTGGTIDQYIRFNGLIDITLNGNKELISSLNDRIALAEAAILKQEEQMNQRFSRLEGLIGRLQSQQTSLTSALAGLGQR